jgi:hypothetical protein
MAGARPGIALARQYAAHRYAVMMLRYAECVGRPPVR